MKIGLYFGSFNPIHNGHLHVATQALRQQQLDEVWLVVSPQNPFKENGELAPEEHRLRMAQLACADQSNIHVCDIELVLPKPSYTIDTLRALSAIHPNHTLQLIIGEDNLAGFERWKEFDSLLQLVELVVYPRTSAIPEIPHALELFKSRIHFLRGELMNISATEIRKRIRCAKSIHDLTGVRVADYIAQYKLYS
jgi:nicotinate-nucleotide adenylyltransferase